MLPTYVWYRLTRRPELQRCVVAIDLAGITLLVWVLAASEVTIRFAVLNGTVAVSFLLRVGLWQDVGLLFRFA